MNCATLCTRSYLYCARVCVGGVCVRVRVNKWSDFVVPRSQAPTCIHVSMYPKAIGNNHTPEGGTPPPVPSLRPTRRMVHSQSGFPIWPTCARAEPLPSEQLALLYHDHNHTNVHSFHSPAPPIPPPSRSESSPHNAFIHHPRVDAS